MIKDQVSFDEEDIKTLQSFRRHIIGLEFSGSPKISSKSPFTIWLNEPNGATGRKIGIDK